MERGPGLTALFPFHGKQGLSQKSNITASAGNLVPAIVGATSFYQWAITHSFKGSCFYILLLIALRAIIIFSSCNAIAKRFISWLAHSFLWDQTMSRSFFLVFFFSSKKTRKKDLGCSCSIIRSYSVRISRWTFKAVFGILQLSSDASWHGLFRKILFY